MRQPRDLRLLDLRTDCVTFEQRLIKTDGTTKDDKRNIALSAVQFLTFLLSDAHPGWRRRFRFRAAKAEGDGRHDIGNGVVGRAAQAAGEARRMCRSTGSAPPSSGATRAADTRGWALERPAPPIATTNEKAPSLVLGTSSGRVR